VPRSRKLRQSTRELKGVFRSRTGYFSFEQCELSALIFQNVSAV
jgi:hypothetical protein